MNKSGVSKGLKRTQRINDYSFITPRAPPPHPTPFLSIHDKEGSRSQSVCLDSSFFFFFFFF